MSRSNITVRELREEFQQLPEEPLSFLISYAEEFGHPRLFDWLLNDNLDEFTREFTQLSGRQKASLWNVFCKYGLKEFARFSALYNVFFMELATCYGQLDILKIVYDEWNEWLEKDDAWNRSLKYMDERTEFEIEIKMSMKIACQKGYLNIVKFFIEKVRLDANVKIGEHFLLSSDYLKDACEHNHLDIVLYLLEKGAIVRNKDIESVVVCNNLNKDILVALLCHIEEEQLNMRRLISLASSFYNTYALKIFIQKFSNKIYIDYKELIRVATIRNCVPTVQMLIEDGYVRPDDETIDQLAQLADYHRNSEVALFLEKNYNAVNYYRLTNYALEYGPDWSEWE